MTRLYDTTPPPVEADEVVKAVAALLSGGAGKPSDLTVYQYRQPAEPTTRSWCVVREPVQPGGRFESSNRFDVVPIQVVFELEKTAQSDPDAWLQDAHAWAFGLLVGQTLSLASGSSLTDIERRWRNCGTAYDADTESYYSAAVYLCPVKP